MTKKEKWIVDKDDGLRLFYGDENFNGSAYPCDDIVFMKKIADRLNKLEKANDEKIDYEMKVKNILKRNYNLNRGLTLEKIFVDLANELGIDLE